MYSMTNLGIEPMSRLPQIATLTVRLSDHGTIELYDLQRVSNVTFYISPRINLLRIKSVVFELLKIIY